MEDDGEARTGTTLDSGGVINVGGLFYHPSRGTFTEFTVAAFEANDLTPFPSADLAFEQHRDPGGCALEPPPRAQHRG